MMRSPSILKTHKYPLSGTQADITTELGMQPSVMIYWLAAGTAGALLLGSQKRFGDGCMTTSCRLCPFSWRSVLWGLLPVVEVKQGSYSWAAPSWAFGAFPTFPSSSISWLRRHHVCARPGMHPALVYLDKMRRAPTQL